MKRFFEPGRAVRFTGVFFARCRIASFLGTDANNAKGAGHAELVLPLPPGEHQSRSRVGCACAPAGLRRAPRFAWLSAAPESDESSSFVAPSPACGRGSGRGNHHAAYLTRGTVTLAGLALGALIGLILAPILPPIPKAEAATSTAGATAGAFDVSDSGAATYSIPIAVPPGVRGLQPSLALTYHSQNKENGLLGIGWGLSGLSVIHRCGATIAIDGFKGGVNYDANDKFCLDGERLIAIGNNEYRTEHESWQKVLASDGTTNPSYFTVFSPDGGTRIYGGTTDSRIEAQGQAQGTGIARLWALNRVQDKRGNALNVIYAEDNANGDYRPTEISYVGGVVKVTFGYQARTDLIPHYEGGSLQRVIYRLSTITTTTTAEGSAKQYRLGYDNLAQVGKSRLMSVTECGYDGSTPACLAPTTFTWQSGGNAGFGGTSLAFDANRDYRELHVADVNGDGKSDLIYQAGNSGGTCGVGQVGLYLSNGNGFNPIQCLGFDANRDYRELHVADVNGDGKSDLIYQAGNSGGTCGVGQVGLYLSNGNGFNPIQCLGFDANRDYRELHVADVNGDGKSDLIYQAGTSGGNFGAGITGLYSAQGPFPDILSGITTGVSHQTTVTYKPLTDGSVYGKYPDPSNPVDPAYPVKYVQDATYVVSSHQQSNGVGSTNTWNYTYFGLRYHHTAARSLGFYNSYVTGPDGITTRTDYYQSPELAGQITASVTTVGGVVRKTDTFTRDVVRLDTGLSPGQVGYGRVLPRLTQTYSTGSDPATGASFGSTTTNYSNFDGYGFPGTVTTSTSDGHTTTTSGTYIHDTANWILGLPASKSVTASWAGQTSLPRTVNYTYGAGGATCATGVGTSPLAGELTSETVQSGATADITLTTTYGYDINGNRCATNVTGWNGAATVTRTTKSAFGWSGRFPGWTQNGLGHTVYMDNYDTRFGSLTAGRDINGLQTTAIYDGFGRKTSETQYANTSYPIKTDIAYGSWNATGGTGTFVTTATPGAGTSAVYNDPLGRPVQSQTSGLWGTVVRKDVQYDNLGRKIKESLPYYSGQTTYWMTYTYLDALGRLTKAERPLDALNQPCATDTTYSGLTVTVKNCKNQSVATTKYVVGWTKSTSDGGGTVTNAYDPFGNLKSVTDPVGNVSTMGYDLRGRKTSMTDPDMGSWTYAYNAFGELIRQKDAKAQVTTMTYDVLGRMKTRTRPEGTTTWTYDSGTKALGKLSSVTSPSYSESQSYEATFGLPATNSRTISGASYTTTTQYDTLARPYKLTYPTGFITKNLYDGYGHLAEVWSDSLATPVQYWKATKADATGAVTEEVLGNGLTSTYVYDPGTGRLKTMDTKNSAGTALRNLSFGWDTVGNLTQRTWYDGTANRTESFGYDPYLNRLTGVIGPVSKTYSYDALGNFLNKSDVGNYAYAGCGGRPHAVCSTSGGTVTTSFTYDANGNMLTGNGKTISWTSFNKIWAVTANSFSTFSYGADDARISKLTNTGTTHYVGKLYEKTTAGSTQQNRHYIHAGANLVAVYNTGTAAAFTSYYHQDHLGSVDAISNEAGTITARLSYDAWGKRRNANGTDTTTPTTSTRGFTKHEHDDEIGLINMNAREYDPVIARFVSADTIVGNNVPSQALNRYDYANNNPLSFVDPSGNLSKKWKKRLRRITKAVLAPSLVLNDRYIVKPAFRELAQHPSIAPYVKAVGSAVVGFFTGGSGVAAFNAGFDAKLAEAYGADFNDMLRIGLKSYATSVASQYVGEVFGSPGGGVATKSLSQSIGNSVAQTAVAQYAESKGINPLVFNAGLFAASWTARSYGYSAYNQDRSKFSGWTQSNWGVAGLPIDIADTLLEYQGFRSATSHDFNARDGIPTGHSLGALRVANIVGQGYAESGFVQSLPFGKVGVNIEIDNGFLDIVNGGPAGSLINPQTRYPCACPFHTQGSYDN